MIGLYLFAGIAHLVYPQFFVDAFPDLLNFDTWDFPPLTRMGLTIISGVCEIIFALTLIHNKTRQFASISIFAMLVVYLFCIHIPMTIDFAKEANPLLWITIVRIPLQFVLLYWAWGFFKRPKFTA